MTRLDLIERLIMDCQDCPLGQTRTNAVPGEGPEDAEVVIIAEGPGQHEDQQGRPFVGPAGKLLDSLLPLAGLRREDVYITNMIKCRAPGNRDPEPEEIAACSKHLDRQLQAINPKLVLTLGKHSLKRFLPNEDSIVKARGKLRNSNGTFVYPVIHPAAGLRRGEYKEMTAEDFRGIPKALEQIASDPPEPEVFAAPKPKRSSENAKQSSLL